MKNLFIHWAVGASREIPKGFVELALGAALDDFVCAGKSREETLDLFVFSAAVGDFRFSRSLMDMVRFWP